jgi:transposase-like protein/ribosomal protein L37AE/L43A
VARNQVQFQKGLSTIEFNRRYGTEEQCRAALVGMRWPDGFVCPKCSGRVHGFCEPRGLFQCRACRVQTSARAGTIFHKSRTPLTKWFLAMHLITASKNDIASLELARQLDVKWDTAWLIKQKLLEVMLQRNSMYKLAGDIQVDDAYQGGKKAGKRGRGAANKLPFVIAVATRDGHPIYTHLRVVPGFTKEAMRDYAVDNIAAGARILTDGLACFNGFDEAGMTHVIKITGGGRPTGSDFKWVNTGLGNTKGAITGTCRSIDIRHTPRYLAGYEWRYNRRFDLPKNLERLARFAVTVAPKPHHEIAAVRTHSAAEISG